jgi:hypothetical protein
MNVNRLNKINALHLARPLFVLGDYSRKPALRIYRVSVCSPYVTLELEQRHQDF